MAKDIMTSGIEMSDVIKSTGFPVPEDMEGKTFAEVVEGGGSGDITVEALSATENKVYTAPEGKAYSPVTVNVPSSVKLCAYYENDDGGSYYGKSFWSVTDLTPTAGASGTIPLIFADLSENGEVNAVENVPYTSDGTYITIYGNNYFRAQTMDKMLS